MRSTRDDKKLPKVQLKLRTLRERRVGTSCATLHRATRLPTSSPRSVHLWTRSFSSPFLGRRPHTNHRDSSPDLTGPLPSTLPFHSSFPSPSLFTTLISETESLFPRCLPQLPEVYWLYTSLKAKSHDVIRHFLSGFSPVSPPTLLLRPLTTIVASGSTILTASFWQPSQTYRNFRLGCPQKPHTYIKCIFLTLIHRRVSKQGSFVLISPLSVTSLSITSSFPSLIKPPVPTPTPRIVFKPKSVWFNVRDKYRNSFL